MKSFDDQARGTVLLVDDKHGMAPFALRDELLEIKRRLEP
jgi:hypothetical protein